MINEGSKHCPEIIDVYITPSKYRTIEYQGMDFGKIKTIKIKSNNSVMELSLNDINDVALEGSYKLEYFYIDETAQKVSITGSNDKPTTLEFNTTNVINSIRASEIVLKNCEIINRNEKASLNIFFEKLTYNKFLIKSKTKIRFGDYIVTTKDDKDYLNARVKSKNIDKYIIVSRDKAGYITLTSEKYYQATNKQSSNNSL